VDLPRGPQAAHPPLGDGGHEGRRGEGGRYIAAAPGAAGGEGAATEERGARRTNPFEPACAYDTPARAGRTWEGSSVPLARGPTLFRQGCSLMGYYLEMLGVLAGATIDDPFTAVSSRHLLLSLQLCKNNFTIPRRQFTRLAGRHRIWGIADLGFYPPRDIRDKWTGGLAGIDFVSDGAEEHGAGRPEGGRDVGRRDARCWGGRRRRAAETETEGRTRLPSQWVECGECRRRAKYWGENKKRPLAPFCAEAVVGCCARTWGQSRRWGANSSGASWYI